MAFYDQSEGISPENKAQRIHDGTNDIKVQLEQNCGASPPHRLTLKFPILHNSSSSCDKL